MWGWKLKLNSVIWYHVSHCTFHGRAYVGFNSFSQFGIQSRYLRYKMRTNIELTTLEWSSTETQNFFVSSATDELITFSKDFTRTCLTCCVSEWLSLLSATLPQHNFLRDQLCLPLAPNDLPENIPPYSCSSNILRSVFVKTQKKPQSFCSVVSLFSQENKFFWSKNWFNTNPAPSHLPQRKLSQPLFRWKSFPLFSLL